VIAALRRCGRVLLLPVGLALVTVGLLALWLAAWLVSDLARANAVLEDAARALGRIKSAPEGAQ
jgi:hypothetical protein